MSSEESSPPAFRVIRVRETAPRSDGKLNPNAYAIDVEVDGKEHYFYVKRRHMEVAVPVGLLRHPLRDVVTTAAALALKRHLSTQL